MSGDVEKIAESPLFKDIEKCELEEMLGCLQGKVRTYKKGEYIAFERENIRNIGIVLVGAVDMIKEDVWGNKTIIVRMSEKQMFGETFACSTDTTSSVAFLASRDSRILELSFAHVMHTCSKACVFHHRLVENMVTLIADKNRRLMEKLTILSKKNLREKILAYLSEQALMQQEMFFEIPLGRQELAEYLCADRSALTRELSNMRKEGIIDFDKNVFRIL